MLESDDVFGCDAKFVSVVCGVVEFVVVEEVVGLLLLVEKTEVTSLPVLLSKFVPSVGFAILVVPSVNVLKVASVFAWEMSVASFTLLMWSKKM